MYISTYTRLLLETWCWTKDIMNGRISGSMDTLGGVALTNRFDYTRTMHRRRRVAYIHHASQFMRTIRDSSTIIP